MAATLALIAALFFALAATLEQKGTLNLPTISLAQPMSIVRLAGNRTWLMGTLVLLGGYLFQAGALDRGRLSVIQPLLVSSVVFVLPLGYFLTSQRVGRREVSGAVAIVLGLGLFVIFGDPAGGNTNASDGQWAVTIVLIVALCAGLLAFGNRGLSGRLRSTARSPGSCSGSPRRWRCRRWTICTTASRRCCPTGSPTPWS